MLTPDEVRLRESMPTLHGYVISLFYCPPKQLEPYEREWRQWCIEHKAFKHLFPPWLRLWGLKRKAERGP